MNLLQRLFRQRAPATNPQSAQRPGSMLSARPTYSQQLVGQAVLPRAISFQLLQQFYNAIPAMGRAADIFTGLAGVPKFHHENERLETEINAFFSKIPVGHVGTGLASFLGDHIPQAIIYGYAVGELEIAAAAAGIARLWTFRSQPFGFRSDETGNLEVLQQQRGGDKVLNPETVLLTSYNPQGCDPNGQSLFFSSHTFCQAWLDIAHAHRSTWRRTGIPIYHINWKPPDDFNDSDGSVAASIRGEMETAWNGAMKSQVIDGRAEDFFSTGETDITIIGGDGAVMDVAVGKRAVVEEIIAATGLPSWMFGYSWSSTERLSTQQADIVVSAVEDLRWVVSPCLLKMANVWARLTGSREALRGLELEWPSVNLQDQTETARAESLCASAAINRQKYALSLWQTGIWGQEDYAEELTGSREVVTPMAEPPSMDNAPTEPAPTENRSLKILDHEYEGWKNGCEHAH